MPARKALTLDTYKPNWTDARTKKRALSVIDWCIVSLNEKTKRPMSKVVLDRVFGQQQNPLSAHLRARLLIQEDGYKPGSHFYNYRLKPGAIDALLLEVEPSVTRHQRLAIAYAEHLDNYDFTYTEKSHRLWHPLQQLKKAEKKAFWAPHLPYDYDISACAPNVVSQLASRLGCSDLVQSAVKEYIDSPEEWRERVMALTGCERGVAKRIINSLFNGARLARNYHCGAYQALDYNEAAMTALMEDADIKRLRGGIKRAWNHIERAQALSAGEKRERLSSREKWGIYFKEERRILDVVRERLSATGNPAFYEHDGWRCKREVDTAALQADIYEKTGYRLTINGGL